MTESYEVSTWREFELELREFLPAYKVHQHRATVKIAIHEEIRTVTLMLDNTELTFNAEQWVVFGDLVRKSEAIVAPWMMEDKL